MSTLHIELSEYDAMRNRNKELEERVKQLEEELKGCKDGSRVIIRKVMKQKEAGRFCITTIFSEDLYTVANNQKRLSCLKTTSILRTFV